VTTIIGLVKNGTVTMGADTQVTNPDGRKNNHTRMEKISKRNGFLIAGAGDSHPCDIMQHIFMPPTPTASEKKDLYKFMITKFVPAMRECLSENGWKTDPDDKDSGFDFLVAYDGELFDIGEDLSVIIRNDGIYGVGNGYRFAVGALYAGATVERALEIAAHNDAYTSAPFQIVKQKKTTPKQ
jgi:ATP-dependent protease HslVU (ClpYQ) peptidase subunit